jgi:hypothetical protein
MLFTAAIAKESAVTVVAADDVSISKLVLLLLFSIVAFEGTVFFEQPRQIQIRHATIKRFLIHIFKSIIVPYHVFDQIVENALLGWLS